VKYHSDSDFSSDDHSNSSISIHINSIDQIEAASDSDRYIKENIQTEANNSHNNCKRKSNKDSDFIIDNKNEEVNISYFYGVIHTRSYFVFNVENTGISGIVLEHAFKLKKELGLMILNRIAIAIKVL